jgi:hypothetical protein
MLLAPLTHPRVQTVPDEDSVPLDALFIRPGRGRFLIFRRSDWASVLVGSALTLEGAIFCLNKWR